MKGMLYGVGVGPGDPELLTAKAIRVAVASAMSSRRRSRPAAARPRWILPRRTSGRTRPILLVRHADDARQGRRGTRATMRRRTRSVRCIGEGKTVAFLTLGDPTVYSTRVVCAQARGRPRLCRRSWCPACRRSARQQLQPWAAPCVRTAKCCTSFRLRTAEQREGLRPAGQQGAHEGRTRCAARAR